MQTGEGYKNKFLPKSPKRLAVIDQDACTGCAGAPTCTTFCETVTAGKNRYVDAIRLVDSPEKPFSICVVEYDKCIGCALCARVCPWDAITMYSFEEAFGVHRQVTVVDWDTENDRPLPVAPETPETEQEPVEAGGAV